jgi:hypothetical protein
VSRHRSGLAKRLSRVSRLLLALILATLAASGSQPLPADAQRTPHSLSLLGVAWDRTTITYSLQADRDVPPSALAAVRAAIREWNARLARLDGHFGSIHLAPTSGSGADIPVALRSRAAAHLGLTNLAMAYQTAGCWLLQAPIELDILDAAGDVLPDEWLFNAAAHELGHALGLGHATVAEDLMYPVYQRQAGRQAPSALDLRGIRAAFAWLGGTSSTPGAPRCPQVRGVS